MEKHQNKYTQEKHLNRPSNQVDQKTRQAMGKHPVGVTDEGRKRIRKNVNAGVRKAVCCRDAGNNTKHYSLYCHVNQLSSEVNLTE